MPDLLFLMQRLPYPLVKGEKIRNWHILHHFRQWYDIHFGCLIDDPNDAQHVETIRALCKDMYCEPLDKKRASLTCTRGLLTGEGLSVTFFRNAGLRRWVRDVMTRVRPEVVFVNSSNMAPYILDLPVTGRRVVELGDVDSEKFRAYADGASFPMRQVYTREWHKIAKLEARVARECDHSVLVSEPEAALFRSMVPDRAAQIVSIINGVDHAYFDPAHGFEAPYDIGEPCFVFTGTMDYKPNIEAVTWFAEDILPLIRATHPGARFFIVGGNPAEDVKRLTRHENVFVTGRVPDVRPYVFHATACVAPMRVARGIQNKVLEAMAMAKPVIVTPGALEGIDAIPGQEVILADGADAFAQAAVGVVGEAGGMTEAAAAIGRNARALILREYDWTARLKGFDPLVRPLSANQDTAP